MRETGQVEFQPKEQQLLPSLEYTAEQAIEVQLEALQRNDEPYIDCGTPSLAVHSLLGLAKRGPIKALGRRSDVLLEVHELRQLHQKQVLWANAGFGPIREVQEGVSLGGIQAPGEA